MSARLTLQTGFRTTIQKNGEASQDNLIWAKTQKTQSKLEESEKKKKKGKKNKNPSEMNKLLTWSSLIQASWTCSWLGVSDFSILQGQVSREGNLETQALEKD